MVQGKVVGEARGRDYQVWKPRLLEKVLESFATVGEGADIVFVEGAGSPAEVNLRDGDIANMGFAAAADVPVILVGDIDRGGVIASIVGTHTILPAKDRQMIAGYLINKFRGDVSLFDAGIAAIEQFTRWPCLGVVPWLDEARRLPAEDSVALERITTARTGGVKVAVPILQRIANFDDLDPLRAEPELDIIMVRPGERLPPDAALVIIPGSKSTIGDLDDFRRNGWDKDLEAHRKRGGHVFGICGGFQMLGRTVSDPDGLEGPASTVPGLGLLDVETVMEPEKSVRNVTARSNLFNVPLSGYEIHLGKSGGADCARPAAFIDGRPDGAVSEDGKVIGTYMHGVFEAAEFRTRFLASFGVSGRRSDNRAEVDMALDAIADRLGQLIDFGQLMKIASSGGRNPD